MLDSETGSELNRFIQKLNFKKITIYNNKIMKRSIRYFFIMYICTQFPNQDIKFCNDYNKSYSKSV